MLSWRSIFPILQWLPGYQAAWLKSDLVAGLTLAAYAVPVSMAYASLAGLPPQQGIYCYLLGGVSYTVFSLGLAALALLLLGDKFLPGRPMALLVVALATAVVTFTSLKESGVATVGALPAGLPDFSLPSLRLRDVDGIIPLSCACFLL